MSKFEQNIGGRRMKHDLVTVIHRKPTEEEQREYDWIEITTWGDQLRGKVRYMRSMKKWR
jgi:hypothetical protein